MKLLLWEHGTPGALGEEEKDKPVLVPYLVEGDDTSSAMVVCPGGGYSGRSRKEGAPIAEWLNTLGISALVVHYRVSPYLHPHPLSDAQRAIQLIRSNATKWNIDPERVGILGFSAGGHVAASAGTLFHDGDPDAVDPIARQSCKPNLMVLCYPVITFTAPFAHSSSRDHLLGSEPDPALVEKLSLENAVTSFTPPAFIWHTGEDEKVPMENALMFAAALRRKKVPFELHVYESGRHGLCLAADHPEASSWTALCENWLRKQGFIK
ncbi:alpha/beta hydrolase [Paenibacillus sp. OAS669]|uniref:alpha/beta hydrolase n=1 Tax=Paenibacillus sp. OAS669 TaxID=2663821 RepID=UPI00178BDC76|nr:alpha/beta hydrolase [Paenibacillus sp. OAS669]MBE1442629.1 acetyl esterase/lipase [Paenibacillus sp. OAS669]